MNDTVNAGWVLPEDLHQLVRGGRREVVEDLIAIFKQNVSQRLRVLREALLAGDLVRVGAEAHTIKESAVQVGAFNLVTTCRHLELDASHHVIENLERLVLEAEAELHVLQRTMHRLEAASSHSEG